MLRALPRTRALLLLAMLGALLAWSLSLHAPPVPPAGPAQDYSDLRLYQDVAGRVAAGESYYAATTSLQRAHGFPTHPFPTVRLPTLVFAAALLGWSTLRLVLAALLAAAVVQWMRALDGIASPRERVAALGFLLAGAAMVASPALVGQHELWAGVLLASAFALRLRGNWRAAVTAAAFALAVRELALPFVLLALAFALAERRRAEAVAWGALVVLFGAAIVLHAGAVAAHVRPGDLPSQGWTALRGPGAALRDLGDVSLLTLTPPPLRYALALLPLFGWLAAPAPLARFGLPLFAGYMAMLALFAREQNFYWAIMLLPGYFIGFAFLPRMLKDLAHALLAGRRAAL